MIKTELERKKSIKIITYENFPFGGAPANLVRYISLALSKEGSNIEVLMPTGNVYGKNVELKLEKNGYVEDVKYRHLVYTKHPRNYFGKLLDLICGFFCTPYFLITSNFRHEFDTIISYNTHITRVLHLIIFKKIFNKKLILILPEFYEKPYSMSLSLIHWYDFYFGLKYLAKHANAYIPASHYLKEYLQKELKINKPILVLPNLMDPEIFKSEKKDPFIEGKITIGYTGTPTRKDGVVDLINSFGILNRKYSNIHLLIVGDVINGNSVIPQLKELSIKLGCNDHITFTGLVPFVKIPKLLNSCQVLALTRPSGVSAEAGFPTKLGEYFACKKPVLITSVGDIPMYLKNEEDVIITRPNDVDSIVEGFEKIFLNNELSEKLSRNGFNWMNNNLNYRNMSKKLINFINLA
jgi:glycosyltransferase involved in cell wall biosynthesis